jgi:hypothetical protein
LNTTSLSAKEISEHRRSKAGIKTCSHCNSGVSVVTSFPA